MVVASVDTARGFEMMLGAKEEEDLHSKLTERFDDVLTAFARVDARKASATHEEDKTIIFERIRSRTGGFEGFNATVVGALRQWLLRTARALLAKHVEDARLLRGLGMLESAIGSDMAQALVHFERALAIEKVRNGTKSTEVGTIQNNIASVYRDQGRYDEALELYHAALAIYETVHGADHSDVASTQNNIAGVHAIQGRFRDALEFKLELDHPLCRG